MSVGVSGSPKFSGTSFLSSNSSASQGSLSNSFGSSDSSGSCSCNFAIDDITLEIDDAGSFRVTNNSLCDLTVSGYDGVGFLASPALPFIIGPGAFSYMYLNDVTGPITEFRILTVECGYSPYSSF